MSALGIRNIIVATDLSAALIPALQTSLRLARLTDAGLHIIHTTESQIPASRLTDHLQAAEVEPGPTVNARIMVGPPGALIVQEARRLSADVIVLGPHQPGRSRLGSTAYRVVLDARTPCLMLPAELTLPLRRVLAPLDLAAPVRGLLTVALTWASALRQRDRETELLALSVASSDQQSGSDAESLEKEIAALCSPSNKCAGLAVSSKTLDGSPPDTILETAEQWAADLIVMGTRRENLKRDALGSVSREVVSRAQRPVLLVPRALWSGE